MDGLQQLPTYPLTAGVAGHTHGAQLSLFTASVLDAYHPFNFPFHFATQKQPPGDSR